MTEEQIMEQREQAIKRLRSLFDMHSIPFGAPEHLGGLLLNLHENRHFAMDFWSVVNAHSDSGSGELTEEQTLNAVVESATGVAPNELPAHERPGVDELRQLLAGVDVARPVELPQPIAQPADALLPRQPAETKSSAHRILSGDEAVEKRRSIGDALARLEQSTRELRAQLAQIDAEMAGSSIGSSAMEEVSAAGSVLDETKISSEQHHETQSKWDRMSAFAEAHANANSLPQEVADDCSQIASPRSEAAPPKPVEEVVTPVEASHVAIAAVVDEVASPPEPAAPQPSTSQPPPPAAQVEPVPVVASKLPEPEAVAVFDPQPPSRLGQRGLAVRDPDDDPQIRAPFSAYAAEPERSSMAKFAVPAIIVALLAAGGYAGSRTETGSAWLQSAVASVRSTYNSVTGHSSETPAPASAIPPTPTTGSETAATDAPTAPAATQESPATPAATTTPAPAPVAQQPQPSTTPEPRRLADAADSANRLRTGQQIDASVLRVPASTMAANLITSRVPAYPDAARAQGIEGAVVMDVVVTQTGMVKFVRVIDGDRRLRVAAEDAVLRWHYKPYMLNGQPVEVATTVKLDFRLPE